MAAASGRSARAKKATRGKFIFQYYYPKYKPAADKHGQGVNKQEIIWAQNQRHKLYRDGSLYTVLDRYEKTLLNPGGNAQVDRDRKLLQEALDSMPDKAVKLSPSKKKGS